MLTNGYQMFVYLTPHILKFHNVLMLTTPHLPGNITLQHERIVICSGTRNKVSIRYGMTIYNTDLTTNANVKIIHILSALSSIAVVDLLI
jgi:hypothetical protein